MDLNVATLGGLLVGGEQGGLVVVVLGFLRGVAGGGLAAASDRVAERPEGEL